MLYAPLPTTNLHPRHQLGALKAIVGGSGHADAGASNDAAEDLLGTRAWRIDYDVGSLIGPSCLTPFF